MSALAGAVNLTRRYRERGIDICFNAQVEPIEAGKKSPQFY